MDQERVPIIGTYLGESNPSEITIPQRLETYPGTGISERKPRPEMNGFGARRPNHHLSSSNGPGQAIRQIIRTEMSLLTKKGYRTIRETSYVDVRLRTYVGA